MDSPVSFSSRVYPVCLPPASNDPDQHEGIEAAVMGWGPTGKMTKNHEFHISLLQLFNSFSTGHCFSTRNYKYRTEAWKSDDYGPLRLLPILAVILFTICFSKFTYLRYDSC
jgi:hypothetical protein